MDDVAEHSESRASWPEQVIGGKYVRLLEKQLAQLRDEAPHGNRELFLDDVFVVYLLAFFNPSIRSLRTIEDFSQTRQAQKHLTIRKICKSTLSDFNQLAEPRRLEPIIAALRGQLSRKAVGNRSGSNDLHTLLKRTVAVDGTFIPAVAEVAWAIANRNNHGGQGHRARIDTRLEVSTWLPEAIVVPEPGQSEADSAIEHLQPGRLYLYDRGFMSFDLVAAHYQDDKAVKSHFVMRFKTAGSSASELVNPVDLPLSEADRQAGIISDRLGYFVSDAAWAAGIQDTQLREIVLTYEHDGKRDTLRLITNLLHVSAATIALLYRCRWQVELFFRWFKSFGNFGHLISHQREGVLAHLYVTIIAALLMYLHTGFRPSKYLFALLGQVAVGAATLEEIMPILRERERRNQLERESAARRRARKKLEGQ